VDPNKNNDNNNYHARKNSEEFAGFSKMGINIVASTGARNMQITIPTISSDFYCE